ncbi:MAG: preprotein translocase subunit SecE [Gammaproteobacteria bacterium]|nr:preprotein translocase subunit SecE [Gammaproteobacteria bacterium]
MIDKIKLGVAALILVAGFVAYYQMPGLLGADVSILLRVGVVLVSIVVALAVAATSQYGMSLIDFSKGSRIELRKMVWPTRPETIQTTAIVLVLVVIVALFLWLVDAAVFNIIYDLLLGIDD